MEATLVLCDQAQAVNGKLYLLGGGWDTMRRRDAPTFVTAAGWIDVGPDDPRRFDIQVDFVAEDANGAPFRLGEEIVSQEASVEIVGDDFPATGLRRHIFALGFIGVPFPAGVYRCRLTAGQAEIASSRFQVIYERQADRAGD